MKRAALSQTVDKLRVSSGPRFNVFSHDFQTDWPPIEESFAAQSSGRERSATQLGSNFKN
jgi:hypothetical protein